MATETVGTLKAILTAETAQFDAGMKASAKVVSGFDSDLKTVTSTVKGLAGALGVGLGVAGIANLGRAAMDAASNAKDLSDKLGISIESAQRFRFAAEQTGTTVGTMSGALTRMNNALTEGKSGTVQALRDAGLSLADLRAMEPDEAFLAIAEAIRQIPDPMRQTQIALELFGRSGAELLPGIKEGFAGIAQSASVMSDETVRRLEAAQDAWAALGNSVVIHTGEALAGVMGLWDGVKNLDTALGALVMGPNASGFTTWAEAIERTATQSAEGLRGQSDMARNMVPPMTDAAKAMAEFEKANAKALAKQLEGIKAWEQSEERIMGYVRALSGSEVAQKINDTADAVERLNKVNGVSASELPALVGQLNRWVAEGRTLPPVLLEVWANNLRMSDSLKTVKLDFDALAPAITPVTGELAALELQQRITAGGMEALGIKADYVAGTALPGLGPAIHSISPFMDELNRKTLKQKEDWDKLAGALGALASVSTGAMSTVAGAFSNGIRHMQAFGTALDGIKGFSVASFASIAGAATSMIGIIQAGIAAISAVRGLWHTEGDRANDIRDDLMGRFGNLGNWHGIIAQHGNDPELMRAFEQFYFGTNRTAVQGGFDDFMARLGMLGGPGGSRTTGGGGGILPGEAPPIEPPSFAFGSGGFRDFGAGTPAILHGVEEVRTAADARAQAMQLGNIERLLQRMLTELPINMRSAVQV